MSCHEVPCHANIKGRNQCVIAQTPWKLSRGTWMKCTRGIIRFLDEVHQDILIECLG